MKKIASFTIDHTILPKGMYLSRVDGNAVTYDIRTRRPNTGEVMENGAIHTLEHLFATCVRNSEFSDKIIYFGPMGCRTGFYFITHDSLSKKDAVSLSYDAMVFCSNFEGDIPGVSPEECGNYRDHNLVKAKEEAGLMAEILKDWTEDKLTYPVKK